MKAAVVFLFLLASTWPSAASAADEAAANTLLRQGADLFRDEHYEQARAAFAHAYELDPKPATLFNLALAELNANHPVEAATHWREYLTHSDEPAAKLLSVSTKWLPRAEAQITQLDIFAPPGTQLSVDGVLQTSTTPTTPSAPSASIALAAGEHDVSARKGTIEEAQHVSARGGELVELHFQHVADAPAPPPPTGWARPPENPEPAGEGLRTKRTVVIALGLGTIAAASVGLAFGVAAKNKATDAQATQSTIAAGTAWTGERCSGATANSRLCTQLKSDVDANRQDWTVSAISYVAAGVLGAATVATWLWWKPSSRVTARPILDPRDVGVVVDGHRE